MFNFSGGNCTIIGGISCVTNSECKDSVCRCIDNHVESEKVCKADSAGVKMTGVHVFISLVGMVTYFVL